MKKFSFFLIFILGISFSLLAQFKLEFESFEEDPTDLSARTKPKIDLNGDPAAVLKIQLPMLRDATISSPLKLGDEDYIPGEIKVYLGDGSRKVTVRHPDFEPFEYQFDKPLKGKCVYKLVLKVPNDYLSAGLVSVRITTNVLDADLRIDGEEYNTQTGEFFLRLKEGDYPYTIRTDRKGFSEATGILSVTESIVKEVGRIDEYVAVESEKQSNLHITGVNLANLKIDGRELSKIKGSISLPQGRHRVDISDMGYTKTIVIDLVNDNETLDADIRVPVTIVSPSSAEFTLTPLENALKPSVSKFKAGQAVRLLGRYRVTAKAKGYDSHEFELNISPDMTELKMSVPMTSNAHKLYVGTDKIKQNTDKSLKEYRKLIANSDEVAMWEYGLIMTNSGNVPEGNKYIRMAADAGHPTGALYTAMKIVKGNLADEKRYLDIALNGGEQFAHQIYGDIYSSSSSFDPARAFDEYSKYNSPYSRVRRAQLAINNPDVIKVPFDDLIELLESVVPEDINYPYAQSTLGEMAYKGIGMPQNSDSAYVYWSKIDASKLPQHVLLIMAVKNLENDDFYKYVQPLQLNAITEERDVANGISITQLFTRGAQRLDKNYTSLSYNLLQKAYDLGDRSLTTLSYLGKYYKEGVVAPKDISFAKDLLKEAVDKYNDVRSMRWLGNIYESEKNVAEAEKIYRKAVGLNDSFAKGYLATILYNKGKNNYSQAVKLWSEAAEAGHKQSVRNLINYYEKVTKNKSKVNYWKSKL